MEKLLIVDDEVAIRSLLRINLADKYEIIDTGSPEHAFALALHDKPNAILLDLRMPKYSGFELCRTFSSLTAAQLIPLIIISGEAGATTKSLCKELGASAYFEKPIDFDALRAGLEEMLHTARPERRSEVRVRLRVTLRLRGTDAGGNSFEEMCPTENISLSAFLCGCKAVLKKDSRVEVDLIAGGTQYIGSARVVRQGSADAPYAQYAFRFIEIRSDWILK
jgi:DNA-binding response OmpR family regulator